MDQSGVADVSMILTMSGGDEGLYLLKWAQLLNLALGTPCLLLVGLEKSSP